MKIRSVLRSAFNHPFLLTSIFSLLILYKFSPFLFHLLISLFPTILFTAIFLGIILLHGEPNPNPNQNRLYQLNQTRIGLTNRSDPTKPTNSHENNSYESYDSTSDSELNPSLDEIHPLLESAQVSESESESESEKDKTEKETEKKVVAWTADDQKALQQIGTLELERNTHLENLIARRKAVRKILERDLIDLDGFDAAQFQMQPVIAPRRNPFDLPEEEEIPGSAPSVLLPKSRNPFDFPFDQMEEPSQTLNPNLEASASSSSNNNDGENNGNVNENGNGNGGGNVTTSGFMSGSNYGNYGNDFKKNALFRRHESFTIGAPVQFLGEIRPETRGNYYNNRFKPFFMLEKTDLEEERESSERSGSLERETPLTHDDVSTDESSSVEGERKEERELSDDDESKSLEKYENYDSSSSEEEGSNNNENLEGENEKTVNLGPIHEAFEEEDDDTDSNVQQLGKVEDPMADCHVADPVYDSDSHSSPTAHEKSSILVEALFKGAKTESDSNSTQIHSPPKEKREAALNAALNEEKMWVAPSLASVDEIESRTTGLSEIKERDIIGSKISEIHDDLSRPITPIVTNLDR